MKRTTHRHGGSYLPEYRAWQTMRLRCHNPANRAFKDYGARGITVCDRWRDDFPAFLADVGSKPSPKHEIDRIDNDRAYEPGNVRWVLRRENCRNRRSSYWVTFHGERRLLIEVCEQLGVDVIPVRKRLEAGWDAERALTTPVRHKSTRGLGPYSPRPPRQTRSGVRGVTWHARRGMWRARAPVSAGGVRRELGLYLTVGEAEAALVRANVRELQKQEAAS